MLSRRVLIIEDDADAAGALEAYLRRENYDVTNTGDGLPADMAQATSSCWDDAVELMAPVAASQKRCAGDHGHGHGGYSRSHWRPALRCDDYVVNLIAQAKRGAERCFAAPVKR